MFCSSCFGVSKYSKLLQCMMWQLVVCICLLAACYAQDHLTCSCLKPAEIFTQPSPQTPMRGQQGPPGKLGPKGEAGSRGLKGIKGEPGIPDNQQISLLQEEINSFHRQVETLNNKSAVQSEISQLLINIMEKELHITPLDGYLYKLTSERQSWQGCRRLCRNWGGDLAVHGIKTINNRRNLMKALSINAYFWIGVSDIASEGNWVWVNGEPASTSELNWSPPNPTGGNQDCGALYHPSALADDGYCTSIHFGLCEKKI